MRRDIGVWRWCQRRNGSVNQIPTSGKISQKWGTPKRVELVRGQSVRRTGEPMTLSLPPFTKAVTWLVGINTGVFLLRFVLELAHVPATAFAQVYLALTPSQIIFHGWVWQLLTYGFVHFEFWHWFGNMLGL